MMSLVGDVGFDLDPRQSKSVRREPAAEGVGGSLVALDVAGRAARGQPGARRPLQTAIVDPAVFTGPDADAGLPGPPPPV